VAEETPLQISAAALLAYQRWLRDLAYAWREETPLRIHSREYDWGGAPEWHPEFARWIERLDVERPGRERVERYGENSHARLRATRAFRKLRRKHPREFDVLYAVCILGMPLERVARSMTERAILHGKPERYTRRDIQVLTIAGLDKVMKWW